MILPVARDEYGVAALGLATGGHVLGLGLVAAVQQERPSVQAGRDFFDLEAVTREPVAVARRPVREHVQDGQAGARVLTGDENVACARLAVADAER
jgi:hypothetical protein